MLIFNLHCQLVLRIAGNTNMLHENTSSKCKILFVPEEGWFGQPKYGTSSKTPFYVVLFSAAFYILHFICEAH